ncbi:MAG: methionyl-tRNA formyltransferase [Actinomycetia bacterium]|nr:methionyl-tRNA formyltransferase [Actinomycetes bacterium]
MAGVFLGSPSAAVPSLAAFCDVEDVDLVITQPDRRAGRGGTKVPPPVKVAAEQFGLSVAQPHNREELFDVLASVGPSVGLVVAFGRILTPAMLSLVPYGFLNVHFSLLPRWRGAAPVERAIASGDEMAGVTLMKINEGLDTGPILGEIATPIGPNETGGTLTARLAHLGASLVDSTLPEYLVGRRRPVPQLASGGTIAGKLTKEDARLVPDMTVITAERAVRAFSPRPGAWMRIEEGDLRVHRGRIAAPTVTPGRVELVEGSVLAGFSDGSMEVTTVQPPGKGPMSGPAWMNGRRGEPTSFGADAD